MTTSMKRISVFAPLGALDHQTSIINAVTTFARAGYHVDVYAVRNRRFAEPAFNSPNVRVHFMPWSFDSGREPRTLVTLLFTIWLLATFWRRHHVIYAGGIRALIAAYVYSLFRRTQYINYQMELYVGEKLRGPFARVYKALERRAARRAHASIEHSEERADVLAQDLGIPRKGILIVPNAPIGTAEPLRSRFLHHRLGLDESTHILLSPGTMSEQFLSSTIVRAARRLPAGWNCVMHSAGRRDENDPYIRELRELAADSPVTFSLNPVPYCQIDEILGSARIGIALYTQDAGPNWSTTGLSSGKLSHFLKVGVPVIVSPLPGLVDFVRQHGIGEILEEPSQLPALVAKIESDWEAYQARALRCFDEQLSFDRNFQQVLDTTSKLIARG
jgi:glycosyltransferase involved in cell wall biosynthesis